MRPRARCRIVLPAANLGDGGGTPSTAQPQAAAPQSPPGPATPPNIVGQRAPSSRKGFFGLGCLVSVFVLLALIAGGGFIGWRIFSDNVLPAINEATSGLDAFNESPPGPCYDLETEGGFLSGWTEISCSGSRQVEVSFSAPFVDEPFPGDDYLAAEAADTCAGAFETYVGIRAEQCQYSMNWLVPTEATWAEGNRDGICLVMSEDGSDVPAPSQIGRCVIRWLSRVRTGFGAGAAGANCQSARTIRIRVFRMNCLSPGSAHEP